VGANLSTDVLKSQSREIGEAAHLSSSVHRSRSRTKQASQQAYTSTKIFVDVHPEQCNSGTKKVGQGVQTYYRMVMIRKTLVNSFLPHVVQ
jgi:hypothetical protein